MTDPNEILKRADRRRTEFAATVAAVRNDPNLSDVGKRDKLAGAWVAAQREMETLRREYSEGIVKRRRELEKSVFGIRLTSTDSRASAWSDYRNALMSADGVKTEAAALRLLERAERIGDETFARALTLVAVERDYGSVLERYAAERPDVESAFQELAKLEGTIGDRLNEGSRLSIQRPGEVPYNALVATEPAAA